MNKILNTPKEDYHIHSINFSDGMNTIDEIVQYAHKIWLKKITITDHSQATLDAEKLCFRNYRSILKRLVNIHNNLDVKFGVEWDLLDEEWDCCFEIWKKYPIEEEFCILSCHDGVYKWDLKNITQAYINAIKKYHDKIKFIWHICHKKTSQYLDIPKIAKVLNDYNIPIEIDCSYLILNKTDTSKLDELLKLIKSWVYINSDAHCLNDLNIKEVGFQYLKDRWYI